MLHKIKPLMVRLQGQSDSKHVSGTWQRFMGYLTMVLQCFCGSNMTQPQFCFCGKCLVLLTHLLRRLSHFQKEICNVCVCVVVVCVILNVIFLCARDRSRRSQARDYWAETAPFKGSHLSTSPCYFPLELQRYKATVMTPDMSAVLR